MFVGLLMTLQPLLMGGECERSSNKINCHQLELKKENTSYSVEFFLDLGINLEQKKKLSCIIRELIFPFSIVKMPHTLQIMFLQKCFDLHWGRDTSNSLNCK